MDDELTLPHAVALTWGVAERPQRGPKREMSIERIVDAAIEIADAEGIEAVSMSRVATSLGYTTMSLYRYVTSKDDLLLVMEDAVYAVPGVGHDPARGWQDDLRVLTDTCLQVFRAHPWVARVPVRGVPMTPNNLFFADWALAATAGQPLTVEERLALLLGLTGLARVFGALESEITAARGPDAERELRAQDAALRALVTDDRFPALAPVVRSGGFGPGDAAGPDPAGILDVEYRFNVERLLAGAAQLIADRPSPPAPVAAPGPVDRRDDGAQRAAMKDPDVRDAVRRRKEAEAGLREAASRERELIARAVERARR